MPSVEYLYIDIIWYYIYIYICNIVYVYIHLYLYIHICLHISYMFHFFCGEKVVGNKTPYKSAPLGGQVSAHLSCSIDPRSYKDFTVVVSSDLGLLFRWQNDHVARRRKHMMGFWWQNLLPTCIFDYVYIYIVQSLCTQYDQWCTCNLFLVSAQKRDDLFFLMTRFRRMQMPPPPGVAGNGRDDKKV